MRIFPFFMVMALFSFISVNAAESKKEADLAPIYSIKVKTIDGKETTLEKYRGKAMLIVNTASRCGYTYQYEGLQKLYKKYEEKGLVVLGFPSNDFGRQEPGTNKEIATFCSARFEVTFPMFEKISTKGRNIHPLYQYLTDKKKNPEFGGKVNWNFNKFLISKEGKVIGRFKSKDKPSDKLITDAVIKALK